MNYLRVVLAALSATVAYFLFGGIVFGLLPQLRNEFQRYPAVYRSQQRIKTVMPLGMAGIFLSIFVLAVMYATADRGNPSFTEGARFGSLIGLFAVGAFVLHNYVNLNIGIKLTVQQAVAYLVQWTIVGMVIGAIYRPTMR
jgi:hypothetical protein